MLYGYKAPHLNFHQLGQVQDRATKEFCQDRTQLLQLMKQHLVEAQSKVKHYADKNRTERSFVPGDMVYLKVKPYRQSSMLPIKEGKLAPKFYGPFLVTEKVGAVAYKLKLLEYAKIHPVFHVSLLKKKIGLNCTSIPTLPSEESLDQFRGEPIAVLERRMVKKNNAAAVEVLVQWDNTLPSEATWEDWDQLHLKFPHFQP